MARASLTPKAVLGPYPGTVGADALDLGLAAANVADGNQFLPTGRDVLVAMNTGGTAHTITLTSAADSHGRKGDVTTYQLAAGELHGFKYFATEGWVQSDGYVYVNADHAEIKLAVLQC